MPPPVVPNGAVFGAVGQTPRSQFQSNSFHGNHNHHANSLNATPPGSPNLARNVNQGNQVLFILFHDSSFYYLIILIKGKVYFGYFDLRYFRLFDDNSPIISPRNKLLQYTCDITVGDKNCQAVNQFPHFYTDFRCLQHKLFLSFFDVSYTKDSK